MKDFFYTLIGDVLWALDRSRLDEIIAVCAIAVASVWALPQLWLLYALLVERGVFFALPFGVLLIAATRKRDRR